MKLQFDRTDNDLESILETHHDYFREMEIDQLVLMDDGYYVYKYSNSSRQEVVVFRMVGNEMMDRLESCVEVRNQMAKYLARIFKQFYLDYVVKYIKVNSSNFGNFSEIYKYYNSYLVFNQTLKLLNLSILLDLDIKFDLKLDDKSDD